MKTYLPLLLVAMVTTLGGNSLTRAERLGVRCKESGAFYCHDSDPTSFTRCIDNDLHVFHCPDGLHFNTLSQTCDWPMNADCKGSGGGYKHGSSSSSSKQAASADWSNGSPSSESECFSLVLETVPCTTVLFHVILCTTNLYHVLRHTTTLSNVIWPTVTFSTMYNNTVQCFTMYDE